ncbi:hypothetical protein ZIOFF_025046 [Zingiber officinale]|uniref:UspA domain-containing protein n=1 Tax=Zingiber officinale TaxID=94328 RepID=A0A8J5GX83_ZINOF|nr:hypothetical protein ZIOFF_025046 [Zingiber officinale]
MQTSLAGDLIARMTVCFALLILPLFRCLIESLRWLPPPDSNRCRPQRRERLAVKWAVQNYLRPGDIIILLHVRSTSVLYGADWGAVDLSVPEETGSEESQRKLEDDFDAFTTTKAQDLAQPLVEAQIPFKIHIVKDHDMKERLCLEVERLNLSAVIMGSRGFGASRKTSKGRLGSVSDYCVHHCVCPVVVVRYPDEGGATDGGSPIAPGESTEKDDELHPVPEEDEYHDATGEIAGVARWVCRKRTREKLLGLQAGFAWLWSYKLNFMVSSFVVVMIGYYLWSCLDSL